MPPKAAKKPSKRKSSKSTRNPAADHAPASIASGRPGTERARDEQREGGGPRYAGGAWQVADERGDLRFGHARTDDADPSELAPGEADNDDNESPSAADPELAKAEQDREIESGGQHAGMYRGEKPRKKDPRREK